MSENASLKIWQTLQPMVRKEIAKGTESSIKSKKMVVTTAFNASTKTVGVTEAFGTEIQAPVAGMINPNSLTVGAAVWVIALHGNWSNAIVWMLGDGNVGEINAQTLGGKAPEYYIQPRNLLDNSDFTNPVNQRGQTSYSGASQYTIDRWRTWTDSATIAIVDGGISVTNESLFQYNPLSIIKDGKQYTGVIGYADGSVYCAPFVYPEGNGGIYPLFASGYDDGKVFFRIYPSEKTVAYVALYEGAYTAETLPPYVPKGYVAELAECQRYYENSWFGLSKNEPLQTISLAWAANSCEGEFRFSTEKRTVPTMTAYPSGGRDAVCVYANGYQPVSNTTWLMRSGLKGAWLRATMGSAMLTIGYAYGLHAHWEASADL